LRRAVAALTAATGLLTVVASADVAGAVGDSNQTRVASSGEALANARSAKFRGTTTSTTKTRFDGTFDFERRAGEYSINASALGLPGKGKTRVLIRGSAIYFSLDALGGSLGSTPELAGKKWLKLDPETLRAIFGDEASFGQSNPSAGLDALRGATGDVKKTGRETVRGTRTTRYRAQLDLDQAVAKAPEDQRTEVAGTVQALGSGTVPADVWVDGKGRVRKIRLSVGSESAGNKGSVVFEYFELGSQVSVEEPPSGEVVDFADVLGGSTPPAS